MSRQSRQCRPARAATARACGSSAATARATTSTRTISSVSEPAPRTLVGRDGLEESVLLRSNPSRVPDRGLALVRWGPEAPALDRLQPRGINGIEMSDAILFDRGQ